MEKITFSILLLILVSLTGCNSDNNLPESIIRGDAGNLLESRLTPEIEVAMTSYDLPGMAVGVVLTLKPSLFNVA